MTSERRSAPIITLSLAASNSAIATTRLPRRAASSAASLTRLARSAPEKPGVPRAITFGSTSEASGTLRMWTRRIFSRPFTSGFGTTTWRSNRPGRSSAGSSTSGRLVAAIRMTPSFALEAVHLDQHLVQRLLALVIAAAEAGAAMAADGVDLVDEDDAGRVLLALLEHVAHPARADAHEHLDEVGARDGEERHVRLARDGAGKQRLTGAGRADQQHALRDLAAEALEFLRVLQELDDLLQLGLASSMPATSSNVTRPCFSVSMRARDLPKPIARPPPDCIWRMKNTQTPISSSIGNQHSRIVQQRVVALLGLGDHAHALIGQALTSAGSSGV